MSDFDPRYLIATLAANVNNEKMTDEAFREFVRNTLPIYQQAEKDKAARRFY